jgi:hypothetical protein
MTRLALTALILAIAALTRSPAVVAWVLTVVCAVWLGSHYLTLAYRRMCKRMDADIARVLSETEDPITLADSACVNPGPSVELDPNYRHSLPDGDAA